MKNKPVQLTSEYLKCLLFHLTLYPLFVLISALGSAFGPCWRPGFFRYLPLGLVPILFYHLRDRVTAFWTLFLSHVLLMTAGLILPLYPDPADRVITGFFLLIYLIYSLNIRVGAGRAEDKSMPKAVAFGMTAGALFLLKVQGGDLYLEEMVWNLILCIMIAMINDFLEEYCRFLFVNESSTGYIPTEAILKRGLYPVLVFDLILGITMFAVSHVEFLTRLWNGLMELLKRFSRWFFSHFQATEVAEEEILDHEPLHIQEMNPAMMGVDTEPALIWVILQNIMIVAVEIFLVLGFFYLCYRLVRFLRDSMRYRMKMVLPEMGEEAEDIREKLDLPKERRAFPRKIFSKESNNDKVRRVFRSYVKGQKAAAAGSSGRKIRSLTVGDWEKVLEDGNSSRHLAYRIYEAARYSGRQVSEDEVNTAKEAFRENLRRS